MIACKVCGNGIPPSGKRGRPATSHLECKGKRSSPMPSVKPTILKQKRAPRTPKVIGLSELSDAEILETVQGRKVTWVNSISGNTEDASVPRTGDIKRYDGRGKPVLVTNRHLGVMVYADGTRVLTFTADPGGFRSVRIDETVKAKR